jgi:predicted DsbA family dithiol-disulfide isomerase
VRTEPMETTTRLTVDVFADVVCPWCYIGMRRLERALAERPGVTAERRWRPFQLRPELPAGGEPWADFIQHKFGGEARARRMFEHVTAVGAAEGITLDFDRVANAPNTVDAHRLILFAGEHWKQWELAAALFRGYFAEGMDLTDRVQLVDAAARCGLDPVEAAAYLDGTGGVAEVRASQQAARELGVHGVPFYVFDARVGVSGAQPAELFVRAIDAARGETGE